MKLALKQVMQSEATLKCVSSLTATERGAGLKGIATRGHWGNMPPPPPQATFSAMWHTSLSRAFALAMSASLLVRDSGIHHTR